MSAIHHPRVGIRPTIDGRLFPDEIVCCGEQSVWVPYTDPGLALSRVIRAGVQAFVEELGGLPRVILLQNHGVITLGGSLQAGGIHPMTPRQVRRISSRPDEHERRRMLKI